MRRLCTILSFLLSVSGVYARTTGAAAEIRLVGVLDHRNGVGVEITLTSRVTPKVVVLSSPPALAVELEGTLPGSAAVIPVNRDGVKSVRAELYRSNPPVTRVVILLEHARPYALATDGNKITLTLLPTLGAANRTRRGAEPAASAPLFGGLRSHGKLPRGGEERPAPPTEAASASHPPFTPPNNSTSSPTPNSAGPFVSPSGPAHLGSPAESAATASESAGPAEANASSESQVQEPNSDVQVAFKVKYVAQGVAYLEGGRSAGLAEGFKLLVKETDPATGRPIATKDGQQVVAQLNIFSVAETSAASEIHEPARDIKPGDWAFLSSEDTAALVVQRSLSATRKYPAVISFTAGDPLDEEARVEVPRPPLPEINRARGRIGFDYSGVMSHGASGMTSNNLGIVIRTDITRINGTYWNLTGYWRGRLSSRNGSTQTLQDVINRTYHLGLTYDNPQSRWVAGFGRLYLPWATSLDTIDGGYFGRRAGKNAIYGIFGGSTPDPTSWSYDPNRRIGGAFVNFEGGDFNALRYTSTSGLGISTLKWKIDRPFVFFENGISYKRVLSIYQSLQADSPRGNPAVPAPGAGISRSFTTLRIQPHDRFEINFNHTYFRDLPTYDPQLIGTGLLDKYLFQGFSAGVRVEVAKKIWVYNNLGRSSRSGDTKASLNQMYGVTFGSLPWVGVRADFRYSRFDSSFGGGTYKALSLSHNFRDNMRWEVLAGQQSFASTVSKATSSRFVTGNFEANLGPNYFLQSGYTWNRGGLQNYDQWSFTFGYRFDSRSRRK